MNKLIRLSIIFQSLKYLPKCSFYGVLQNHFCHLFCTVNQKIPVPSNNNPSFSGNKENEQHNLPPEPPNPEDCCEDGCANCVWLNYVTEVKFYYKNSEKKLLEAFEIIPSVEHREFVKFSLKELEAERTNFTD